MTEQEAIPDVPAPTFPCPLHVTGCTWRLDATGLTTRQINTACESHTEDHTKEDYLEGLGVMAERIGQLRLRIDELESALRGAAIMMGGPVPGQQPPSGIEVPGASGNAPGLHVVTERKHGDVVNIGGQDRELVGKRMPDWLAKNLGLPTRKDHEKRRRREDGR